jgi:hypothetical protein
MRIYRFGSKEAYKRFKKNMKISGFKKNLGKVTIFVNGRHIKA